MTSLEVAGALRAHRCGESDRRWLLPRAITRHRCVQCGKMEAAYRIRTRSHLMFCVDCLGPTKEEGPRVRVIRFKKGGKT